MLLKSKCEYKKIYRHLTIVLLFMLIATSISIASPLLLKELTNLLSDGNNLLWYIYFFVIIYALSWTFNQISLFIKGILSAIMGCNFDKALSVVIYDKYIYKNNNEEENNRVGDIISKTERSATSLGSVFYGVIMVIIPTIIQFLGAFFVITTNMGIIYSFIFIIGFICCFFCAIYSTKITERSMIEMNKEKNNVTSFLVERLSMVNSIKIYNAFFQEKQDVRKTYKKWLNKTISGNIKMGVFISLKIAIIGVSLLSVLLLSASNILSGSLTIGDFIMMNAYIIQLTTPLTYLIASIFDVQKNLVNLEEANKLIQENSKDTSINVSINDITSCQISIEIKKFNKNYDGPLFSTPLTCSMKKNEFVVIKGDSGSGKTTLFNAINKLIDYEGNINIDGVDIQTISRSALSKIITAVTQKPDIIQGTLLSNLQYGNKTYLTEKQAINYCKLSCLGDFLSNNIQGLAYPVETNGDNLSGGQKMRLAIARAIARNSDVIILDEPTASLDETTEKTLIQNLKLLEKTVIIISHSPMVAGFADRVINLNTN